MSELEKDWMAQLNSDLAEMDKLMDQTVAGLRRMTELQQRLRNQYGDDGLAELRDAMYEALNGWMASNC